MTYEEGLNALNRCNAICKLGANAKLAFNTLLCDDVMELTCNNTDFAKELYNFITSYSDYIEDYFSGRFNDYNWHFNKKTFSTKVCSYAVCRARTFKEEPLQLRFLNSISDKLVLVFTELSNINLSTYMQDINFNLQDKEIKIHGYSDTSADVVLTDFIDFSVSGLKSTWHGASIFSDSIGMVRNLYFKRVESSLFTSDYIPIALMDKEIIGVDVEQDVYIEYLPVRDGTGTLRNPILVPANIFTSKFKSKLKKDIEDEYYCINDSLDELVWLIRESIGVLEYYKHKGASYAFDERGSFSMFRKVIDGTKYSLPKCIHFSGLDLHKNLLGVYAKLFGAILGFDNTVDPDCYKQISIEYTNTNTPDVWEKLIALMNSLDGLEILT